MMKHETSSFDMGPVTGVLMDAALRHAPLSEALDATGEPGLWRTELPDGGPVWVASSRAAVCEVLGRREFARQAPLLDDECWQRRYQFPSAERFDGIVQNMFNVDDPSHTRLRRAGMRALDASRVATVTSRLSSMARDVLTRIAENGAGDLVDDFAVPFAVAANCALLGVPEHFAADYLALPRWAPAPWFEPPDSPARAAYMEVDGLLDLLQEIIANKRRHPGDDPLAELIALTDSGALSDGELSSTVNLLLLAGHDPVFSYVTTTLVALWQRPALLAALAESTQLRRAATDELLRYTSPFALTMPRFPTEPVTVCGVALERGEAVVAHLALANRDPQVYPNANRLDPSRRMVWDVTFGHGSHRCPGKRMGFLLCQAALDAVLTWLPDVEPRIDLDQLRWRPGSTGNRITTLHTMSGLESLPVTFTPTRLDSATCL